MLMKGTLEPVGLPCPEFYSQLFLVENVTGLLAHHQSVDALNGFVTLTKLKMETVASVLESVRKGDWMFSIAVEDTYFQISVHPESRSYLRFCLEGLAYQLRALGFDLSTAPQVFTRVFALVSEWEHRKGVYLLRYLDNWLVIAESRTLLLQHWDLVLQLCKDLGIVVNWEKSDLRPSTHVQYLGMLIHVLEKVFLLEVVWLAFGKGRLLSCFFHLPMCACGSSCWATQLR